MELAYSIKELVETRGRDGWWRTCHEVVGDEGP